MGVLAVGDIVWQTLIQVVTGAVVTIVLAWLAIWAKRAADQAAKEVAKEVQEVKATLADTTADSTAKLNGIASDARTSLKWQNHIFGVLLGRVAEMSREKAKKSKDIGDVRIAEEDERLYATHLEQQAKMDAEEAAKNRDSLTAQIDAKLGAIESHTEATARNTERELPHEHGAV